MGVYASQGWGLLGLVSFFIPCILLSSLNSVHVFHQSSQRFANFISLSKEPTFGLVDPLSYTFVFYFL